MSSERKGEGVTGGPGSRALEAASAIEQKSDELIVISGQLVDAWNGATAHLSRGEMEALYEEHAALGRDVLVMAAILLGQMWLKPGTADTFTKIQADTARCADFIDNALSISEQMARKAAEEACPG